MLTSGTAVRERFRGGSGLAGAERARAWAWPLGVIALAVGSWLLWLPYVGLPLHRDAAGYATAAYWWARGDALYRDITVTRPQGIFVTFRLIEALGLGSPRGVHLFAAAYCTVCALVLLAVAGRVWGRGVGLGAAALFAMMMATPYTEAGTANAELFALLPLLGGIWALLRADEHQLGGRRNVTALAGCGLLCAIALLVQPMGVAALALAALWLLRRRRREPASRRAWLGAEAALAGGFAAGLAPAVAHGLLTAQGSYLQAILFYRLGSDSALTNPLAYQLRLFLNNTIYLMGIGRLPVLLLALVGMLMLRHAGDKLARDLLRLWTLTAFGGAAIGGNWHFHYYQLVLPPLAVAAALQIRALLRRPEHVLQAALQGFALITMVSLTVTLVSVARHSGDPTELVSDYWTVPTRDWLSPAAADAVVAYLRGHSEADEAIYVAYTQPDIYYLARRRPATRWLYPRELGYTPGAFDEQVARLADPASAPRYIVGAQPFDAYGFDRDGALRAVVARDYALEATVEGVPLYRRLARSAGAAAGER